MIAFASIFLGLILGTHTVVVVVSDEVAQVEIRLNGQVKAVLEEAPWSATIDFGDELIPRELVAVAYDAEAKEVARVKQRLNVPKPAAVAKLVIESDSGGRSAGLFWESTAGAEPRATRISFDGRRIDVADPRHFDLPAHDPAQVHFLRAELDFGNNVTSVTEMAFGGSHGAEVTTEITAVPITIAGDSSEPGSAPSVARLQGLFRKGNETLDVIAVERHEAEVIMVIDDDYLRSHPAGSMQRGRFSATLRQGQGLRFLTPEAKEREGVGAHFNVFSTTRAYYPTDAGVWYLMTMYNLTRHRTSEQFLSAAVAIAGLTAAGTHRPRAVVLVLGRKSDDQSSISPEATRAYLEALRVPLYVWYSKKKLPERLEGWGDEVVRISSLNLLDTAVRQLGRDLEQQWIVWLDGVHMPQTIELAPGNEAIRLAR